MTGSIEHRERVAGPSQSRPRLALDGRFMTRQYPGIGRYSEELFTAIGEQDHEFEPVVLVDRAALQDARVLRLQHRFELQRTAVSPRQLADQWVTPRLLRALRIDVFFSPFFLGPVLPALPGSPPCPRIVVVHDLGPVRYPLTVRSRLRRALLPALIRRSIVTSRAVIVPSRATLDDLHDWLRGAAPAAHVVPDAAGSRFRPRGASEIERMARKYGIEPPYVLFLGSKRRHKRVDTLLHAWTRLHGEERGRCRLVLAGAADSESELLQASVPTELIGAVQFLDWVDEEDLPALYSGAEFFVLPSLFEGFGLTALESMACGTPVLCSSSGSLPEVVGEAALLFEAEDAEQLQAGLRLLLGDPELRSRLGRAGIERAAAFSWRRAARQTLSIARSVVAPGAGAPAP